MRILNAAYPPAVTALVVATLLGLCACSEPESAGNAARSAGASDAVAAELILTNGRIYSFDWPDPSVDGRTGRLDAETAGAWLPDAQAIAFADGRVLLVGSAAEVQARRASTTKVIDLKGATVLPGLVDSHTHVFELGSKLERVNLDDALDEAEAVARVVERAKTTPAGEWIVGQGWDEGAWANNYPTRALLTQAVPEHPVYMRSLHGFAVWGNDLALERAGITADTEAPVGGEILRDADGEPTGVLLNRATTLLEDAQPPPSNADLERQLLLALKQMAKDGYVSVHEAGVTARQMGVLEDLEARGELPLRFYSMLSLREPELLERWITKGPDTDADSMLVTRAVKGYFDGALGSRGARLLTDYSDKPGHRGVSGDSYAFDGELAARAMAAGFQLAIHAIGDEGNRATLDFIAEHQKSAADRHRIEHAQVVARVDMPRFGSLGVVASMQPPHAAEDKTWAEDRLGPERVRGAYAWRSLREQGAGITFNADNPGSDHSIFYGLHAAVTRRDKNKQPTEGWYVDEALTLEETILAYTAWAAHASFAEDHTGRLAPGRWGDVTVLGIDPFEVIRDDPGRLLDGQVLMTVVNGRVVFADAGYR